METRAGVWGMSGDLGAERLSAQAPGPVVTPVRQRNSSGYTGQSRPPPLPAPCPVLTTRARRGRGWRHIQGLRVEPGADPAPQSRGIGGTICCGLCVGGQREPGTGQSTRTGALSKAWWGAGPRRVWPNGPHADPPAFAAFRVDGWGQPPTGTGGSPRHVPQPAQP